VCPLNRNSEIPAASDDEEKVKQTRLYSDSESMYRQGVADQSKRERERRKVEGIVKNVSGEREPERKGSIRVEG